MRIVDFVGILAAIVVLQGCSRTSADPILAPAADPHPAGSARAPAAQSMALRAASRIASDASAIIVSADLTQSVLAGEAIPPSVAVLDALTFGFHAADPRDRRDAAQRHAPLAAARERTEQFPDDPHAHQGLGAALLANGEVSAARRSFEGALKCNATYVAALASLARLDLQDGRTDLALDRFEKALLTGHASTSLIAAYEAVLGFAGLDRGSVGLSRDARAIALAAR